MIKNNDDEEKIEVKVAVANEKEYNQWVAALKELPNDAENFLLPESYEFEKEGFCGSTGFVTIIFNNFPFILTDEIQNRKAKLNNPYGADVSNSDSEPKYFDEPELWYLVFSLIEAGHLFHSRGKKIGDVRPDNVFIN